MANPQAENGYTQIANEILEHLIQMHLSPNEWQVLLCIIRKTYGFHKKVDYIANCQMVEATGLCKAVISRVMRALREKQMIVREGTLVGFQKDWDRWRKLAEPSTKVSSMVNSVELAKQSTSETNTPEKLAESSKAQKLAISSQELAISSCQLAEPSTKVSSPHVTQKKKEILQKKFYKRNESSTPDSGNSEFSKKGKLPPNPLVTEISLWLEKGRGYPSPKYPAEAAAIKWMLDHKYSEQQIHNTYNALKKQRWYKDKEVFMWHVQDSIGFLTKGGLSQSWEEIAAGWEKLAGEHVETPEGVDSKGEGKD